MKKKKNLLESQNGIKSWNCGVAKRGEKHAF